MKVAILGMGVMGAALAEVSLKEGHQVVVYNRTLSKTEPLTKLGAYAAETPEAAINEADAVVIVLADGIVVSKVMFTETVLKALKGKKILNASTTTLDEILEMDTKFRENGASLSEVTLMTGPTELANKECSFTVGTSDEDEQFWKEYLTSVGKSYVRVGQLGDATKAETPALVASLFISVAVAYSVAITSKLNVPREIVEQITKSSLPGSEYLLNNMITRDHSAVIAPINSFSAAAKTVIRSVQSLGIPSKVIDELNNLFTEASNRGYSDMDGSAVIESLLDPKSSN